MPSVPIPEPDRALGDTTSRSVVCLHGLRRSPVDWEGVSAALPHDWPVRAPALPADPDRALAVADEAIAPGDVVFAHSMGAVVALRLLAARPRPLAALVLTGAFFRPARNGRSRRATLGDYLAHRAAFARDARRGPAAGAGPADGARLALTSLLGQAMRPERPAPSWEGRPTPVLVVHARDDHHVPVDFAIAAAGRNAGWELAVLDSGGHHVHVVRPNDWAGTVVPWLRTQETLSLR